MSAKSGKGNFGLAFGPLELFSDPFQGVNLSECRLRISRNADSGMKSLRNGGSGMERLRNGFRNGKITWNAEWGTTACSKSSRHVIG